MIKIKTSIVILLLIVAISIPMRRVDAAEPQAGAVNYFYSMTGATRVSVDMQPRWGESGYHFYSLATLFTETNYGMYAGIQTIGNLGDGVDAGNIFIFSVWNATQAFPAEGVTATPFGGEGDGYSLRKQFDWSVGTTYRVSIQRGSFDAANNGYRWTASVKNLSNGSVLNLGEILAPSGANTMRGNAVFHERYTGVTPECGETGTNLEKAGTKFSNLSSDVSVSFSGSPAPNNLFSSSVCAPYIHISHTSSTMQTGFGLTEAEFNEGGTTGATEKPPVNKDTSDSTPVNTDDSTKENPPAEPESSQSTENDENSTETSESEANTENQETPDEVIMVNNEKVSSAINVPNTSSQNWSAVNGSGPKPLVLGGGIFGVGILGAGLLFKKRFL